MYYIKMEHKSIEIDIENLSQNSKDSTECQSRCCKSKHLSLQELFNTFSRIVTPALLLLIYIKSKE